VTKYSEGKGAFNPVRIIGGKKYHLEGHGYDKKADAEYMAKQWRRGKNSARVVAYKSQDNGKVRYCVFVHYK
jgi:hypothetical protein